MALPGLVFSLHLTGGAVDFCTLSMPTAFSVTLFVNFRFFNIVNNIVANSVVNNIIIAILCVNYLCHMIKLQYHNGILDYVRTNWRRVSTCCGWDSSEADSCGHLSTT